MQAPDFPDFLDRDEEKWEPVCRPQPLWNLGIDLCLIAFS
jgi:hypothetical protein